jgi:hypothetical protein
VLGKVIHDRTMFAVAARDLSVGNVEWLGRLLLTDAMISLWEESRSKPAMFYSPLTLTEKAAASQPAMLCSL